MVNLRTLSILVAFNSAIIGKQPTLRGMLTFTPGYLTAQKTATYGLGGELEIYTGGKLSLRGDGYALLGTSQPGALRQNYQGFLGVAYNFHRQEGVSAFMGFQPGFGLAQAESASYSSLHLLPVFSPFVGVHYFAETLFHFTLCLRYVYGDLHYPTIGRVQLGELRLAFGLGMQL